MVKTEAGQSPQHSRPITLHWVSAGKGDGSSGSFFRWDRRTHSVSIAFSRGMDWHAPVFCSEIGREEPSLKVSSPSLQ